MKITAKHRIIFTMIAFIMTLVGLIITWCLRSPQWLTLALFGWLGLLIHYSKYLADYKEEQRRKEKEDAYWKAKKDEWEK